jgi:hypothetical protein
VLAGCDRVERDRRVRERRRRDRDRVDTRQRERVAEVRQPVLDLETRRARSGLVGIASDQRVHLEARGAQRAQVRDAAESSAHDHDSGHAGRSYV